MAVMEICWYTFTYRYVLCLQHANGKCRGGMTTSHGFCVKVVSSEVPMGMSIVKTSYFEGIVYGGAMGYRGDFGRQ